MKVRFFDIRWDMSDEQDPDDDAAADALASLLGLQRAERSQSLPLARALDLGLPSECILDVEDDIDLAEDGSDVLSQEYGWLVTSCSYEIVK